jgi:hypothetical protein
VAAIVDLALLAEVLRQVVRRGGVVGEVLVELDVEEEAIRGPLRPSSAWRSAGRR